ncbi:hypothetical protein Clacol_001622 [Clathrus columnatus]|uniref:Tr-type G domain-containing protein n=1 Tax=Clathrus columnatus TaxID=1419009 RepID=A0AAV5A684_9AGAM|nr:hypothetical protein Clacol_001622 [Clathrus columnatus]
MLLQVVRRRLRLNVRNRYIHVSDAQDIRNIALVAHIDSGKTTLTESILHKSNYLPTPGSVDTGSTTTDFLPAERERGITIQSASIPVKWKHYTYNLIDTPGHADFGMEVESASRVIDGAVVLLDSVEGVEAQTRGVWRQLNRYNVPTRLLFLNKLDRPGASLHHSYMSVLANRLHPQPVILTLPVASFDDRHYATAEPGVQGIVDLIKWEVWKFKNDNTEVDIIPLPTTKENWIKDSPFSPSHPLVSHLPQGRTQVLDSLSMHSEDLLEYLLGLSSEPFSYLSVPSETILPKLRDMTLRQAVLPVLCGSALKHIGTDILLNYVGYLLANPLDVTSSPDLRSVPSHVQLLAWKVGWDKRMGWMTYVRIYSGTLKKGMSLLNVNRGTRERVSKLVLLYASQFEEVDELPFGSVGVILGLKSAYTGDTFVTAFGPSSTSGVLRDINTPSSVVSASVVPRSYADMHAVQDALNALVRTDPSARVDEQEGQLLLHGLGALHLEILEGRLRDEWGVQFQLGKRRVSYREGFAGGSEIDVNRTHEMQIGGSKVTVSLHVSIRAAEDHEKGDSWNGNVVVDNKGRLLPSPGSATGLNTLVTSLVEGLSNSLYNSYHTGLPRTRVHLTIHSYTLSEGAPVHALAAGAAHILRHLFNELGMGPLMEPYIKLKVEVVEEYIGPIIKDILEHQGDIVELSTQADVSSGSDAELSSSPSMDNIFPYKHDGLYVPPGWLTPCSGPAKVDGSHLRLKRSLRASAPLIQMLDYSARLRALSGGTGLFEMETEGFRNVSENRKWEILRELGRA